MQTSADITDHTAVRDSGEGVRRPYPTVAVVPVAGHGTRLRPLSTFIPKELLPVGGKLALQRIVEELVAAGIQRVLFITSPEKLDVVQKCFGITGENSGTLNGIQKEIQFEYIIQGTMRGLGDAILQAKEVVGNYPFVVALGDAVYEEAQAGGLTRRLVEVFVAEQAAVGLAVQAVPPERIQRYGVVRPAVSLPVMVSKDINIRDFLVITDIVEKPSPTEAPSNLAAAARYVVIPEVFALLEQTMPDAKGEVQFTHALQCLLRSGGKGIAVPLHRDEIRHDIGSFDSYYRAFAAFALNDPEHGESFRVFLRQKLQESGSMTVEHDRET